MVLSSFFKSFLSTDSTYFSSLSLDNFASPRLTIIIGKPPRWQQHLLRRTLSHLEPFMQGVARDFWSWSEAIFATASLSPEQNSFLWPPSTYATSFDILCHHYQPLHGHWPSRRARLIFSWSQLLLLLLFKPQVHREQSNATTVGSFLLMQQFIHHLPLQSDLAWK